MLESFGRQGVFGGKLGLAIVVVRSPTINDPRQNGAEVANTGQRVVALAVVLDALLVGSLELVLGFVLFDRLRQRLGRVRLLRARGARQEGDEPNDQNSGFHECSL